MPCSSIAGASAAMRATPATGGVTRRDTDTRDQGEPFHTRHPGNSLETIAALLELPSDIRQNLNN